SNLVYDCLSTARFDFIINSIPQGNVIPSRGLRQGCLVSPYLFLLCAEGFFILIQATEDEGRSWECNMLDLVLESATCSCSLLSIIFLRAKINDCLAMGKILEVYERA
ncbi:hypothetical protein PanWU01x14_010630, partial [Parasponia andersonii]